MKTLEEVGRSQSKPLVAIEYVVRVQDVNAKEPIYLCLLCDKKCDPRNIVPQMVSQRHRLAFLVRRI
jgi:hypothetical protein